MSNPNFDNIVASTLKAYWTPDGKAVDNIFKRTALLSWLKDNGIDKQGGTTAVAPIMHAKNTTFQNYADYDTLVPAVDQIQTAAEYSWKQSAIYIPMSGMEEAKNSGDRQIISLLKSKTENAERTAAEQFETMFLTYFGLAGSGVGGDGVKAWGGLPLLVSDSSLNTFGQATVGGIDGNANSYWRSPVRAAGALTLQKLSNDYNNVSYGADACNFEITTQVNWERYENLLQPNLRFMDSKTAEAGFSNLIHRGAKVVWSDIMPADKWYFLNSNHLKLAVLSGKWMNFRGFITPFDKDAKYGLITCYGALITNERRKLAVSNYNA
jgi:hypothetical protein